MSSKTVEAIAEEKTIFDDRPISESELEMTESGDYALYVAARIDSDTDEVHLFPVSEEVQGYDRVYKVVKALTGDPDQLVSKVHFEYRTDGRLIFQVERDSTPEGHSPSREVANYLISQA